MSAFTICSELIAASINDEDIRRRVLFRFLAENGKLFIAIDNPGMGGLILDKYKNAAVGPGSGPLKFWLRDIVRIWPFKVCQVSTSDLSHELEIFARVCMTTKLRFLLCDDEEHYKELSEKYKGIKYLTREMLKAKQESFEEQIRMAQENPEQIKILFLSAEPTDEGRIEAGREHRTIDERLQMAKLRDEFRLFTTPAVRPPDLTGALLRHEPHVVHFSGHGSKKGQIFLEDDSGSAKAVDPDVLAKMFKSFSTTVRCVILNACYSAQQAKGIARSIQYVIGIKDSISNDAAIAFSLGFYQALSAGKSIPEAHSLGCVQAGLQGFSAEGEGIVLVQPE